MSNGERWITKVEAAIDRYIVDTGHHPFAIICTPVADQAMREVLTGRKEFDTRPFTINGVLIQADNYCDPDSAYFVSEREWRTIYG